MIGQAIRYLKVGKTKEKKFKLYPFLKMSFMMPGDGGAGL